MDEEIEIINTNTRIEKFKNILISKRKQIILLLLIIILILISFFGFQEFNSRNKVKLANKAIKPAINFLIKKRCKKIILGCTELPIAIFAYKPFKTIKSSKIFLDPNLILANSAMKKYKNR